MSIEVFVQLGLYLVFDGWGFILNTDIVTVNHMDAYVL